MSSTDRPSESRDATSDRNFRSSSRSSSLATHATSQSKLSNLTPSPPQDGDVALGLQEATESTPIRLADIHQHGLGYLNDPHNGRLWLSGFPNHHSKTEVSEQLVVVKSATIDQPQSLVPLLGQLISAWFDLTQQKRKSDRALRHASFQEQDDFLWLLNYTSDYLSVCDSSREHGELGDLCLVVTKICQQTSQAEDINASIKLLHTVVTYFIFPVEALKEALDVFCAAEIILSEPPDTLASCIKLLLSGPVGNQALEHLLEFVIAPTVQNNSHRLNYARGAVRQLRANINLLDAQGRHIVNLSRLLNALYKASKCCIFKHCTEIIATCDTILISTQIQELLSTHFSLLLDTIDHCTRTSIPRALSTRTLLAMSPQEKKDHIETDRSNTKHLAERKSILKLLLLHFENVWPLLHSEQKTSVSNLYTEHIRDLTDAQAVLVISFLQTDGVLNVDAEGLGQRMGKLHDNFVRNSRFSAETRLLALDLCANTASRIAQQFDDSEIRERTPNQAVGQNIVDRLLTLIGNEVATVVIRGILNALRSLAFLTDEHSKFPYTELILRRLVWFVKNEREGDDDQYDGHILLFTETVQQIFVRGLLSCPFPALKAFDALLDIASPNLRSRRCRLVALRVLIRVRCDVNGAIYLHRGPESEYIAAALCRTQQSRDIFANELILSGPAILGSSSTPPAIPKQLWSYPAELDTVRESQNYSPGCIFVRGSGDDANAEQVTIRMSDWLIKVIEYLQVDNDWETISFVIVHLGAQLSNIKLFGTSLEALTKLRQVVCTQVIHEKFREPPTATGLRKSDSALCMFNILTALIPYATLRSETIQKGFGDDLVRAFLSGIGGSWEGTARGCIHALCVCSFEIPASVASLYPNILTKMQRNMTQSHLTVHILEFLTQVARLPVIHSHFTQEEITMIFQICLTFLEKAREHHSTLSAPSPRSGAPARNSGMSLRKPPYRAAMLQDVGLPQYASALAYHTMIFWFLSLRLDIRAKYVSWIVSRLVWKNPQGEETIDEQSQVFIDMMQRTAFSDLGETCLDPAFASDSDGAVSSASWIVGLSVVTAETAGQTGVTQIIKRQASGTTYAIYRQLTAPLPSHHVPSHTEILPTEDNRFGATSMLPSHILLQMVTSAAPTSAADQPIPLPPEEFVTRALSVFDKIPTVDSHKIGVLYIADGQTKDTEFLANTVGSRDFDDFLHGLGYVVSLEPPLHFNPQGLQYPRDGKQTIASRDRVTEIVFHVPTMMPNNIEEDPNFNMKKSHVGNCHVVIVFNMSGKDWQMENFPSAVTFVHVVITPVDRAASSSKSPSSSASMSQPSDFYQVHVMTKADFPNVSPAADPKVLSKDKLPDFVRMFALNADVFSQAKVASDSSDDEFWSTWRARLQAIKTLKQRVIGRTINQSAHAANSVNLLPIGIGGGRRTAPLTREESQETDKSKESSLATQLDFGKWTS